MINFKYEEFHYPNNFISLCFLLFKWIYSKSVIYKIIKNLIPKDSYNELKLLNAQVKNVKNKRLIIKLKGL